MRKSLYNIQEEYIRLIDDIELAEGELTEEQEENLEILSGEIEGKSEAYLEVLKTEEYWTNRLDDEIKQLQALKNKSNTMTTRLKDRLLNAVKMYGNIKLDTITISIKHSESVEVINQDALEDRFIKIKTTSSPDKTKIKAALKNGEMVDGAVIVKNDLLKIG